MFYDDNYFIHTDGRYSPLQLSPFRKQSPSIVTDGIITTVKANRDANLGYTDKADRDAVAISETNDSN